MWILVLHYTETTRLSFPPQFPTTTATWQSNILNWYRIFRYRPSTVHVCSVKKRASGSNNSGIILAGFPIMHVACMHVCILGLSPHATKTGGFFRQHIPIAPSSVRSYPPPILYKVVCEIATDRTLEREVLPSLKQRNREQGVIRAPFSRSITDCLLCTKR
jgi:hypothetical protein